MAESNSESDPSQLASILELFNSVGYVNPNRTDSSISDDLFAGIDFCISLANRKIDNVKDIDDALKSIGCPYAFQASQIEELDYVGIYPVVRWLVSFIKKEKHDGSHMNERKAAVLNELELLQGRIKEVGVDNTVQKLASLMKISKALEERGSDFQPECDKEHSGLLSEITELEEKLSNQTDVEDLSDSLDRSFADLTKKLICAKRQLASKLRESVSLKRQLDDLPIQAEIVQYERRFSELDVHMQDRLHRTRKFYATYNALLEVKELMLKEISLLNSLDSQFRDAMGDPAFRTKLIDSIESVLKGTRQKLEKVQPALEVELKVFEALKEQHVGATTKQRRCSALLKAFQEECRKNERLKKECAESARLKEEYAKSEN